MATFNESEKTKIIGMLDVCPLELDRRLDYYEQNITDSMKARALVLMTEWDNWQADGRKVTKIRPFGENKGSDYDPERVKNEIITELARLVFCSDLIGRNSINVSLVRG